MNVFLLDSLAIFGILGATNYDILWFIHILFFPQLWIGGGMVDATDALARDEVPVDNLIQDEPEVLQDLLEPVVLATQMHPHVAA